MNEQKISPAEAIRSLKDFNEKVVFLMQTCQMALTNNMVDKNIEKNLDDAVKSVKEFYQDQSPNQHT